MASDDLNGLIAASKAHFERMKDNCDLEININKESARQKAFLGTLRVAYEELQAKENLLLMMESTQELEPANPEEIQFLDAEASNLRSQAKAVREEIRMVKESLQQMLHALADNWEKFAQLHREYSALTQTESEQRTAESQQDEQFLHALMERHRAAEASGAVLSPSELHSLFLHSSSSADSSSVSNSSSSSSSSSILTLASCDTLLQRQQAALSHARAQLERTRALMTMQLQSELETIQSSTEAVRAEITALLARIQQLQSSQPAHSPSSSSESLSALSSSPSLDAEAQRLAALNKIIGSLHGVRILPSSSSSSNAHQMSLEMSVINEDSQEVEAYTLHIQSDPATQRFSNIEIDAPSSSSSSSVPSTLSSSSPDFASLLSDVFAQVLKTQQLSFLIRESRARLSLWRRRQQDLAQLSMRYSVTTNPTDPRLIVVTLPIAQFASPSSASNAVGVVGFSYARATLLLSPEYPREDCFVHLIAQLEGGPPLTADALLSIQERLNAEQHRGSVLEFVQQLERALSESLLPQSQSSFQQ